MLRLLHRQSLVEDESTRPGETAHTTLLLAVWHQFEFKGLKPLHDSIILGSMSNDHEIRQGRHCVFKMHVHWVFVTKYRRGVFTKAILEDLQGIFASVCVDFEAKWVEFDGEDDHVHLLVEYPPKVMGWTLTTLTASRCQNGDA